MLLRGVRYVVFLTGPAAADSTAPEHAPRRRHLHIIIVVLRPIVSGSDSRIAYCVAKLIASAGALSADLEPRVFWHFCRSIGSLVEGRGYEYVVALSADSRLKIFLDDPYWSRMLADNYRYEPDFLRLLLG